MGRAVVWRGDHSAELEGSRGRNLVEHLLSGDVSAALAAARAIAHPWYRCQSLSFVAMKLDDSRQRAVVVAEAFSAANELDEPNRIATVSSWPIEVLVSRGPQDRLRAEVSRLLSVIETEPHSLRRADGLNALLHRVWADPDLRARVLSAFTAACAAGHWWRRDRLLRRTAERLTEVDPAAAGRIIAMIEDPRIQHRAERQVAGPTGIAP